MTFLAPTALIGTLLLAIPVLVHLFKPRKMRATPFSSLRWLEQAHQRISRRVQWHQWLLFLARAGVLLLLVLALARPLLGTSGRAGARDRVIMLDVSRSMGYQAPGLATPWENALGLVDKLAGQPRPGERTGIVLVDKTARLFAPLGADASKLLPGLRDVKPSLADTELGAAFPLVRAMLSAEDKERGAEVVILTDNQQSGWRQADVQGLVDTVKRPLAVTVVDLGMGRPANAWIAGARLSSGGAGQERSIVVEVAASGEGQGARSLRLKGIAGVEEEKVALTPQPGRLVRALFRLPGEVKLEGQTAELHLDPADGLAGDDVYHLPLEDVAGCRVLLIAPEAAGSAGRPVNLFLRTALEALNTSRQEKIAVTAKAPQAVTVADVNQADVFLVAGALELPEAVVERLEGRVKGGAGLVAWLGPTYAAGFFNERWHRPLQPVEGLSPVKIAGGTPLVRPGTASSLTSVRWQHPALASLNDPVLGDWSAGLFHQYLRLEGELGRNDRVLAKFEDGTAAVIEHPLGAGRVVLINASANDDWTDLPPRRAIFVPLVDRLLVYLEPGGGRRVFEAGEAVTLALAGDAPGSAVTIVTPSGKKMAPRVSSFPGHWLVSWDEASEAGVHRVEVGGEAKASFVINAGRQDSSLAPLDSRVLAEWFAPVGVEVLSQDEAGQRWRGGAEGWPLWPLLIAAAMVLLAVETVYAARLCPRRQPAVVESVIHGRGILGKSEVRSEKSEGKSAF